MHAFLWTPTDLIRLDLAPARAREARRLARQDERLIRSTVPVPSMARRTAELVTLLDELIAEVRRVPAYDAAAAHAFLRSLEERADRLRPRWPYWLYQRVAERARYRLLPHPIQFTPGAAYIPHAIQARAAQLRRAGALILAPPPPGTPGRSAAPMARRAAQSEQRP